MFTGIIEDVGFVENIKKGVNSAILKISSNVILEDLKIGDSVSVNGICLTASKISKNYFYADVMHETLNRSTLGKLKNGDKVNLERAMSANGRFGGHIVSGHIDGIGTILNIKKDDNAIWYTINADEKILKYIVEKGSVAIDGISLTVAKVEKNTFSVSVIPHTVAVTILGEKKVGDFVNIENDIVGKYIERLVNFSKNNANENNSKITRDFLSKYGF